MPPSAMSNFQREWFQYSLPPPGRSVIRLIDLMSQRTTTRKHTAYI